MPKGTNTKSFTMTEKVFLYPGESANWHFVPITKSVGVEIKTLCGKSVRGFGSRKVEVTIGQTTWQTSIFPDSYSGSYILPLKTAVRKQEGIEVGEQVTFSIKLLALPKDTTTDLVKKITKKNLHPVTDFGEAVGKEIW